MMRSLTTGLGILAILAGDWSNDVNGPGDARVQACDAD